MEEETVDNRDREEIHVTGVLPSSMSAQFRAQDYPEKSVLLTLIENANWEAVLERLRSGPHYVLPTCTGRPKVDEVGFFDIMSPLHKALYNSSENPKNFSPEIIEGLLNKGYAGIHNEVLDEYPLSAACEMHIGKNEAQEAVKDFFLKKNQVVMKILEDYEPAAWKQNNGELELYPIHRLLEDGRYVSIDIIRRICEVSPPEAGMEPNMLALPDKQGRLPLHVAVEYGAPEEVILFILDKYREACLVKRKDGLLPLHCAVYNGCTMAVFRRLVDGYRGTINQTTGRGKMKPLYLLFHSETMDRWRYGNHEPDSRLVPPQDMARILIRIYSQNLDGFVLTKKQKIGDEAWKNRAREFVVAKSEGRISALEGAKKLEKLICQQDKNGCEDLEALIHDMKRIKDWEMEKTEFDTDELWKGAWDKFRNVA